MPNEQDEQLTFREAYDRQLARIEAVPESALRHITTDVGAAATSVLGLAERIQTYRGRLAQLVEYDIVLVDNIHEVAMAVLHLQGARQTAVSTGPSIDPLVEDATARRELFLQEGKTLVLRKLIDPQVFKEIDGGTGHRKLGLDLVGIVSAFRSAWSRIDGRCGVTAAELDEAERVAERLITAVGEREHAESLSANVNILRAKAFTLLVQSYDQLRRGIAFLRYDEGDVDVLFPSFFGGKKSRPRDEGSPTPIHTKPQLGDDQSSEPAQPGQDLPPISKDGPFR
jgi:hypothetical protein